MDYYMIIRFFGLLIVSLYVYWKILDISVSKLKIIAAIIFSLIMSIPLSYVPPMYEFLFLGSVCIFVSVFGRVKILLMLSAVIISVGISLGIEVLSSSIPAVIELVCTPIFPDILTIVWIVFQIVVFILSVAFVNFLFKIKRLQKGVLFWENRESIWLGVILSIIIMICRSIGVLENFIHDDAGILWLAFFTLGIINTCTFGIYFWWRNNTTVLYQQRIKERDMKSYITENEEKDSQIKELLESNNLLAKTVHRDNKLIPAMYNAVDDFLSHSESENEKAKGLSILSGLEELIQERKNMILKTQREHKKLPSVKIERIDNILNYMYLLATEKNIEFDVVLVGNIKDIDDGIIPKSRLETLLADLIENAIIATSYNVYKRILVTMGIVDDCLEITVQDSGIPFEVETLTKLGVEKSTTHADTGGSGIGYMTIFEILKESAASLTITEYAPENYAFAKAVKVRFDGKSEHIVYTSKDGEHTEVFHFSKQGLRTP